LAEVLEISVDVIGSEAFGGISLLVQIGEEGLDVPLSVLARFQGPSLFLALGLEEIFEPCIIAAGRRSLIVFQAAKPFQKKLHATERKFSFGQRGAAARPCVTRRAAQEVAMASSSEALKQCSRGHRWISWAMDKQ
jgi:hypothetical protein